jgi:hypothetical protein
MTTFPSPSRNGKNRLRFNQNAFRNWRALPKRVGELSRAWEGKFRLRFNQNAIKLEKVVDALRRPSPAQAGREKIDRGLTRMRSDPWKGKFRLCSRAKDA